MKIKILLLIAIAQVMHQECTQGCLRCEQLSTDNPTPNCLYCDTFSQYILSNGTCILRPQPNCEVIAQNGACLKCTKNHYLDITTSSCLQVENSRLVSKCFYYSTEQTCLQCEGDFYLENNKCRALEKPITNCLFYTPEGNCGLCEKGFYFEPLVRSCLQIVTSPECISLSRFRCAKCEKGLILDSNFYFDSKFLFQSASDNEKVYGIARGLVLGRPTVNNDVLQCREINVTNCKSYSSFDKCESCETGYYLLSTGVCQKYPNQPIAYCQHYSSLTTCVQCIQGAVIQGVGQCRLLTENELIEGCNTYSSTARIPICTQCQDDKYVFDNKCVARSHANVTGCVAYNYDSDTCKQCQADQIMSSDGLKCLNKISNCQTYASFDQQVTQENLQCTKCDPLYFLSNGACQAGTQPNCAVYQQNSDTCEQCENRYYGAPDCKEHGTIAHCSEYSLTDLNFCSVCEPLYKSFDWLEKCVDLPVIENCKTYADNTNQTANTCTACQERFALFNNACYSIDVDGCIEAQHVDQGQDICTKCEPGLGLATDNVTGLKSCKQAHHYITRYCETPKESQSDFSTIECDVCQNHAVALEFGIHYVCIENEKLQFLANTRTNIDQCEVYKSATLCQRCAEGYFLKSDSTACIQNLCQGNLTTKKSFSAIKASYDGNGILQPTQNVCQAANQNEEWIYAPNLKATGHTTETTVACTGNFISVYNQFTTPEVNYSNVNPANTGNFKWVDHPLDVFPEVECPVKPGAYTINGQANTNPISNCKAFSLLAANTYGCVRCNFGDVGYIETNGVNYLESCRTMTTCSQKVMKNVPAAWDQLFSCHQCTETNQIPVLAYTSSIDTIAFPSETNKFTRFTLATDENWTNIPAEPVLSEQIFCMDVSTEDSIRSKLHIEYTDANYGKVIPLPNCGLAALNLSHANSFDNSESLDTTSNPQANQTLFCAACAPGYKPTYKQHLAAHCERIPHCVAGGDWFNACSQCQPGFRYEYKSQAIQYDSCIRIPFNSPGLDHCYAYQQLNTNENDLSGVCVVCEKGYHLNKDDFCEKLEAPSCPEEFFQSQNEFRDHYSNLAYALYVAQSGIGCTRCVTGFFAYPTSLLTVKNYCIFSEYVQANALDFPVQTTLNAGVYDASNYIDHCVLYKGTIALACAKCSEGFVLRNDGGACVSATLFPHCQLFDASGFNCVKCEAGFGLVTGVITGCVKNDISNCTVINTEQAFSEVTCLTCASGYYLENNSCLQGKIPNCKAYQSSTVCSECEEGYWPFGLIPASNTYTTSITYYCIKKAPETNCKTALFNNSLGDLRCQTCEHAYQKKINNEHGASQEINQQTNRSLCLGIGEIKNCESYDKNLYLTKQIFVCTQCQQLYYLTLDGRHCQQRVNIDANCLEYSPTLDQCVKCSDSFMLSADKKGCISYPKGVLNCLLYSADETDSFKCDKCGNQTYLQDRQCVAISEAARIENCSAYSGQTECIECSTGYHLQNNKCEKINLVDCKEAESANSCKVCNPGFKLFRDDGFNKCISLDKKNCLAFEQNGYNKCLLCKTHYYPDEHGECQVTKSVIQNCVVYQSEGVCKQCQPDYALRWDQAACISKEDFDPKCSQTLHTTFLECNVCKAGYHLVNERCIAFRENIELGCFYYNKKSERCQFCNIGFYMDKDGKCNANQVTVTTTEGGSDTDNTNNTNENNGTVLRAVLLSILIAIFN